LAKCCLCGRGCLDGEITEQGLYANPESLVVTVDVGPVCGLSAPAGAADSGQDGRDDVIAEGELGGDGAGRVRGDLVAT
jgi:hypothetical protein